MNLNIESKGIAFDKLALGLLIMGLSGIFYINPSLDHMRGILAHTFQALGTLFILLGLPRIQTAAAEFRIKDELVAYLSLILIFSYLATTVVVPSIFNVIFPQASGYIFTEMLLFFQFIVYAFSTNSWNKVSSIYVAAERDRALIRILESMRRGANQVIIKDMVVKEILKNMTPDKCFIALLNNKENLYYFDRYEESLPSRTLSSFEDLDEDEKRFKKFMTLFESVEINFDSVEDYISKNMLKGSSVEKGLNELELKSLYTVPISFERKNLGYLILHYTSKYKKLNADDLAYLNKMATQISIAIAKP